MQSWASTGAAYISVTLDVDQQQALSLLADTQ